MIRGEAHGVVPREFLLQHEPREHDEHGERDGLLDDLELVAAKLAAEVAAALAGTIRQYSKKAMPDETRITKRAICPRET